jgi:hypothetical protein
VITIVRQKSIIRLCAQAAQAFTFFQQRKKVNKKRRCCHEIIRAHIACIVLAHELITPGRDSVPENHSGLWLLLEDT